MPSKESNRVVNSWVADGQNWLLEGEAEPRVKNRGTSVDITLNCLYHLTFADGDVYTWDLVGSRSLPTGTRNDRSSPLCPHAYPCPCSALLVRNTLLKFSAACAACPTLSLQMWACAADHRHDHHQHPQHEPEHQGQRGRAPRRRQRPECAHALCGRHHEPLAAQRQARQAQGAPCGMLPTSCAATHGVVQGAAARPYCMSVWAV